VCLCFLPGTHDLERVEARGNREMRLSLHGCGPTAILRVRGGIALGGFAAVELRDLAVAMESEVGVLLEGIDDLRLAGLTLGRAAQQSNQPMLLVRGASRLRMTGCNIGASPPASVVIENIAADCYLSGNRFDGTLSFYGVPGGDLSRRLMEALGDGQRTQLNVRAARLHLIDNTLQLLTIGEAVAVRLIEQRTADDIFQSAAMQGNTFSVQSNVFVSALLSLGGNSFVAEPQDGTTPYGVMIATRAAAAGNVAVRNGDEAILRFLIPSDGGFSGAANQVFTSPQSTP
jgi:hypothetical protein